MNLAVSTNEDSIFNFLNEKISSKNGVLILDSFTGSHKTSSIINFISNYINNDLDTFDTIYYITPRLSNLHETYRELLQKINQDKQSLILKIDSNMDGLSSINKNDLKFLYSIFNKVFNSDVFLTFDKNKISKIKNDIFSNIKSLKNLKIENSNYRYNNSKEHIKLIYKNLQKIFNFISYEDFLKFLSTDEIFIFEKIFFPSMLIRKNKVKIVFTSTQKSLSGFIEPKGLFLPLHYSHKSMFFLDESDAQYNEMISFLSKKQQYNLYDHLKSLVISLRSIPGIKQKENYHINGLSFNELFQKFKKEELEPFIKKYNPYFNIEYKDQDTNFNDLSFLLDINNNFFSRTDKIYNYQTDINAFNNFITQDYEGIKLEKFIEESHNFIDYKFTKFFYTLFKNLFINFKKTNKNKILFNNLFISLLKDFNLYNDNDLYNNTSFYNRLRESVQNYTLNEDLKTKSYYSSSFKYTTILQNPNEFSAVIKSIYIPYSPNHILCKLASKNLVCLSSATSNNPSVVSNFDLFYIQSNMEEENKIFEKLSNHSFSNILKLKKIYKNSYSSILVNTIKENKREKEYIIELLKKYNFTEKEIKLLINSNTESDIYYKRFYSLLQSSLDFINNNHTYGLFFLPKLYNNDSINLLKKLFSEFSSENLDIYSINASDIKSNILENKIWEDFKLNKNQRTIILTHYNTMSSGINLQRPVFNSNKKQDIDYMFFELPTDLLIPSFINNDSINDRNESIVKSVFHLQNLYLNNCINNEIYNSTLSSLMKGVNQGNLLYLNKIYKQTNDYVFSLWRIIEQSVGRMSRTFNKNEKVKISLSQSISEQLSRLDNVFLNSDYSSFEIDLLKEHIFNKNNKD